MDGQVAEEGESVAQQVHSLPPKLLAGRDAEQDAKADCHWGEGDEPGGLRGRQREERKMTVVHDGVGTPFFNTLVRVEGFCVMREN